MSRSTAAFIGHVVRVWVASVMALGLLGSDLPVQVAVAAGDAVWGTHGDYTSARKVGRTATQPEDIAYQDSRPAPLPGWVAGPIPQADVTDTITATVTVEPTATLTATLAASDPTSTQPAATERPTATATVTLEPSETLEASATPSATVTETATPTPTQTPTQTATEPTATEPLPEPVITDSPVIDPTVSGDSDAKQDGPSLLDLVPAGVPLVVSKDSAQRSAISVDTVDSVQLPGGPAASVLMNGRMLVVVEDKAFETGATLSVKPTLLHGTGVWYERGEPTAEDVKADSREAGWLESGEILAFEIEAVGADGKSPITRFDQAVTIYVDLRGLDLQFPTEQYVFLYHDPADPKNPVPVAAEVVDRTGLVGFATQHFSQYSLLANNGPWKFNWNPATVSEFSGAATFSYPIQVPPGVNGFQPSLTVGYSSRSVDGNLRSNMDQGVLGLGWSMSDIAVIRGGVVPKWQYGNLRVQYYDAFTLSLNGAGNDLVPIDNHVVKLQGNALNWNASINRVGSISQNTETQSVSLRFKPDVAATGEQFSIALDSGAGHRLAIHGRQGQMVLQYNNGGGFVDDLTTCPAGLGTIYPNVWYVATFKFATDGTHRVEVYNETFPDATFRSCEDTAGARWVPTNQNWTFRTWVYAGSLYLDDYTDTALMRSSSQPDRTEEFEDQPSAALWGGNWGSGAGFAQVVNDPTSRRFGVQDDPSVFALEVWQQGTTSQVMNSNHLYWVIKTGDGTTHVLGYGHDSENQQRNAPADYDGAVYLLGDDTGHPAVRWNVSHSVDTYRNRINYSYAEIERHSDFACPDPGGSYPSCYTQGFYTQMSRLNTIGYNLDVNANAQTVLTFVPFTEPAPHQTEPQRRIQEIEVRHNGSVIRRIRFTLSRGYHSEQGSDPNNPCSDTYTRTVDKIQEWDGGVGGNALALPATSIFYVVKSHSGCSSWDYVYRVDNGYGGRVEFDYADDGSASAGDNTVGMSWFVTQKRVYASPGSQASVTDYSYDLQYACWSRDHAPNQAPGWSDCPSSFNYDGHASLDGTLVGFRYVDLVHRSFAGTVVDIARYSFWQWENIDLPPAWRHLMVGKPQYVSTLNASYQLQASHSTAYQVESNGSQYFIKTTSQQERTYNPNGTASISVTTEMEYGTDLQGGGQYGNTTVTKQLPSGSASIYRSTQMAYFPNPAKWIVSKPAYQDSYAGDRATRMASVWYTYDGNPVYDSPIFGAGALTAQRQRADGTCTQGGSCNLQDTVFGYDAWGNQRTVTTFTGFGSWYAYATAGPRTTTITFDPYFHIYPLSVANADGTTTGQWDYTKSVLDWVYGPNGPTTKVEYKYDTFARLIMVIKPNDTLALPTLTYTYDATGLTEGKPFRLQTDARETSGLGNVLISQTFTNGMGQEILTTTEYQGNASAVYTSYDAQGRVAASSKPVQMIGVTPAYTTTYPGGTYWTTMTYDALGRGTQVQQPDGNVATTSYGIYAGGAGPHLLTNSRDPLGNQTITLTDLYGRAHIVQQNSGNALNGGSYGWLSDTYYEYDVLDRLWQINNGGEITTITYNWLNQKTGMTDPDMGTWTYTYNPGTGTMATQTDAKSQNLWFKYDTLDRMIEKRENNSTGTLLASYTYGSTAPNIGYRTAMNAPVSGTSSSWTYDSRGRVAEETKVISGRSFQFGYAFDAMDRLTTITYPTGEIVTQTYNSSGALIAASTSLTGNYFSGVTYDVAGRLTAMTYGNGLSTSQTYYGWNETVAYPTPALTMGQNGGLKTLLTYGSSGNYQNFQYTYLSNGNLWKIADLGHGGQVAQTQTFTYDSLNRLTNAAVTPNNTVPGYYTQGYTYDNNGNLRNNALGTLTYTGVPAECPTGGQAQPIHAARSVSGQSTAINRWCYDANGNMVQRVERGVLNGVEVGVVYNQVYDVENRLSTVTRADTGWTTTFTYDADGNRVRERRPDNSYTLFVGDKFEVECAPISAPTITGPTTPRAAGAAAVTWTAITGSTLYLLRINDTSSAGFTPNAGGDVAVDNLTATSYTYTFVAGHSYDIWVHARNACGADSSASAVYTVVVNAAGATNTPTATPTITRTPTRTNTATGPTATATRTPTRTSTATPTATGGAPSCTVLDTFNRANGAIGSNWGGNTSTSYYQITSNQLDVVNTGDAGPIFWNATSFGATQQACVKFAAIDANADDIALILKAQSNTGLGNGLMEVLYDPTPGAVRIWTYDPNSTWVHRGTDLPATFAAGDTLRVVARSNGQVEIYKNTTLLGTRDASAWVYAATGGYIGLWSLNGPNTNFDDFGGGTYSGSVNAGQLAAAPLGAGKSLHLEVPDTKLKPEVGVQRLAALDAWAAAWGVASTNGADSESVSRRLGLVSSPSLTVTPVSPNAGEVFRLYYSAGARPVAVRTIAAGGSTLSVQYLHPDHLGSIGQITDASQAWVQDVYFKPYGGVRWAQSGVLGPDTDSATRRSFTGQYEETSFWMGSLMNYKARFYSPYLNRFVQPDVVLPKASSMPQALNRYSYVLNSPTNFMDPTGHCPAPPKGQAAICVALFIQTPVLNPAGWPLPDVYGDARGFSSNSPVEASRAWVIIPLDGSSPTVQVNASHYDAGPLGIVETPASGKNSIRVYRQRGGQITVQYDAVISGPYEEVAPHINGTISFIPEEDGYRVSVVRDGFPWAEAYYHDGNGNTTTLFMDPAIDGDPDNLGAIGDPHNIAINIKKNFLGEPPKLSSFDRWVPINRCVPGKAC